MFSTHSLFSKKKILNFNELKMTRTSGKNETRYQSGFQKLVALAGQFSNHFLTDLKRLALHPLCRNHTLKMPYSALFFKRSDFYLYKNP